VALLLVLSIALFLGDGDRMGSHGGEGNGDNEGEGRILLSPEDEYDESVVGVSGVEALVDTNSTLWLEFNIGVDRNAVSFVLHLACGAVLVFLLLDDLRDIGGGLCLGDGFRA
jgi:hypothetical protein